MIILHAGVYEKEFFLWGEKSGETETLYPRQRKQKNQEGIRTARSHPPFSAYHAGASDLEAAFIDAGIDFTTSQKYARKMVAWLPTVETSPIASSPLIAEHPVASPAAALARLRGFNSLDKLFNFF